MLLAGAIAGALMMLGPTLLRVRLGVDEVVTTLLLNFVVLLFVQMMLEGPLKDSMGGGWPQSEPILPEGSLPPLFERMRLHAGFIVALIASLAMYVLIARTVLGLKIRAVGENAAAARYAGISVTRVMVIVGALSGALAGLAGASEVAGLKGYLTADMSRGFGYAGHRGRDDRGARRARGRSCRDLHRRHFRRRRHDGPRARRLELHRGPDRRALAAVRAGQRPVRALSHPAAIRWTACSTSCSPRASGPPRSALRRRYMFGVLGALLCERSGVLNLGIEGIFTAGAMAGWMSVYLGTRPVDRRADRGADRRDDSAFCSRCSPCRSACRSTSPASASRCSRRRSPISSIASRCRTSRRRRPSCRSAR